MKKISQKFEKYDQKDVKDDHKDLKIDPKGLERSKRAFKFWQWIYVEKSEK